jgi:hypothetical protein
MKRLARGDVEPIVRRLERQMDRAERHAVDQGVGEKAGRLVRDVGVIAGVSLTMLGIKALKVLPSVPFAPGHKLIILTPLYIVASLLTRSRFGATLTGLVMGTVAFLLGDGRYGVFEILKHVTPGLICDLTVPFLVRGGREPGRLLWTLEGALIGAGRFATIFTITRLGHLDPGLLRAHDVRGAVGMGELPSGQSHRAPESANHHRRRTGRNRPAGATREDA